MHVVADAKAHAHWDGKYSKPSSWEAPLMPMHSLNNNSLTNLEVTFSRLSAIHRDTQFSSAQNHTRGADECSLL